MLETCLTHFSHWDHEAVLRRLYAYFTLYFHQTSINSSYLIFCCFSFLGHRLWYLNYCVDWQEAIMSTENDHFHRSTNKILSFWQTTCPVNPSHIQITESMLKKKKKGPFSGGQLHHLSNTPNTFSQCVCERVGIEGGGRVEQSKEDRESNRGNPVSV